MSSNCPAKLLQDSQDCRPHASLAAADVTIIVSFAREERPSQQHAGPINYNRLVRLQVGQVI